VTRNPDLDRNTFRRESLDVLPPHRSLIITATRQKSMTNFRTLRASYILASLADIPFNLAEPSASTFPEQHAVIAGASGRKEAARRTAGKIQRCLPESKSIRYGVKS
jgi:hypothetical protein